jgi:hypothetical protein
LEEHRRRRSTVAGEAEEAMAGDELAPGPEVLGASLSGVLREEGKVGVWFLSLGNDGVVGKVGDGRSRAKWRRSAAVAGPNVVFLFIKIFKHPHFDIRIGDLIDVQNSPKFA